MDTKMEHLPNPHTREESQLDVCIYQLWYDYEELKSNAKCSSFGVMNMHDCFIKYFSHRDVRNIGMKSMTYWYQLSRRKIYEV